MANSLNKIMILGNLGQDAETRFTTNNVSITNFSVATTYSYKKGEEWVNDTTWHNVTAFKASDHIKDKLKKGSQVLIEGRISKRDYVDKKGVKRYSVDIIAEKIVPCGERSESNTQSQTPPPTAHTPTAEDDDLPF